MRSRDVPRLPPGASLKRDPALVSLSRDHHHALVQALHLRQAAARDPDAALPAARAFLDHWGEAMVGHFADEEEVLLPRAEAVDPAGAARIRAEHDELRSLVAWLEQALENGTDLRAKLHEIGELLQDHVRYEERAFFEAVQHALDRPSLDALGVAIDEHRAARGLAPGCPRPATGGRR